MAEEGPVGQLLLNPSRVPAAVIGEALPLFGSSWSAVVSCLHLGYYTPGASRGRALEEGRGPRGCPRGYVFEEQPHVKQLKKRRFSKNIKLELIQPHMT